MGFQLFYLKATILCTTLEAFHMCSQSVRCGRLKANCWSSKYTLMSEHRDGHEAKQGETRRVEGLPTSIARRIPWGFPHGNFPYSELVVKHLIIAIP